MRGQLAPEVVSRQWVGKCMVVIALLHCLFATFKYRDELIFIFHQGVINSAHTSETKLAIWFLLFGILFLAVGALVDYLEYLDAKIPLFVTSILLGMSVVGAAVLPVSGFWLLFIPIAGLFFRA